jgi:glutamyl/glutaminyl-tRNA synthetase
MPTSAPRYRGRLAPSPTGYFHLGHARTFWVAQERARIHGGMLVLRNEDLDTTRCRPEFVAAMIEDLHWFGCAWQEGPDCGGPCGPYGQSARRAAHLATLRRLLDGGFIYPCKCSRQDVLRALGAPHAGEDEPRYPGTCRPREAPARELSENWLRLPPFAGSAADVGAPASGTVVRVADDGFAAGREAGFPIQRERVATLNAGSVSDSTAASPPGHALGQRVNWRFRVPDGEAVSFTDGHFGPQTFWAGVDFGDFLVWRHDGVPAYQLAVVADDAAMRITEVVRGEDLLRSTARQLLLYRALGLTPPAFFHCPLLCDEHGVRLAKRHAALSLRQLRAQGFSPEELRARPEFRCGVSGSPSGR